MVSSVRWSRQPCAEGSLEETTSTVTERSHWGKQKTPMISGNRFWDGTHFSSFFGETRWSPRTRMPTRMLKNRNNTYLSHFPANPLVGHTDVTLLYDTLLLGHSCLTLLQDTLTCHSFKTLLLDTSYLTSCKTLSLDTLAWHSSGTLLLDILVRHSYLTLFWDTFTWHFCKTLLTWHSCKTLLLDTSYSTLL